MAFDIAIKKNNGGICLDEWISFVNKNDSFFWVEKLPGDKVFKTNGVNIPPNRLALWFSNPVNPVADLAFMLSSSGEMVFGLSDDFFLLQKIIDVAKELNGYVEADDGTILNEVNDIYNIDWGE